MFYNVPSLLIEDDSPEIASDISVGLWIQVRNIKHIGWISQVSTSLQEPEVLNTFTRLGVLMHICRDFSLKPLTNQIVPNSTNKISAHTI